MSVTPVATTAAAPDQQIRHKCAGGHMRLFARVVGNRLEFKCDSCHEAFYWDQAMLDFLSAMLRLNQSFTLIVE